LLGTHEDQQQQQFVEACKSGNLDEVKRLLAAGVSVDSKDSLGMLMLSETHSMYSYIIISSTGTTALMWVIIDIRTPIVKYLLENGADVDALDNDSMLNLSL